MARVDGLDPGTALQPLGARRRLRENRLERLLPRREPFLELGVRDHERAEDAVAVRVDAGLEEQQTADGGLLGDARGYPGRGLLRPAVLDVLDRDHRADAANVSDRLEALLPREHPRPDRVADPLRRRNERLLLEHVEDGDG